jgi:hypothetical protein
MHIDPYHPTAQRRWNMVSRQSRYLCMYLHSVYIPHVHILQLPNPFFIRSLPSSFSFLSGPHPVRHYTSRSFNFTLLPIHHPYRISSHYTQCPASIVHAAHNAILQHSMPCRCTVPQKPTRSLNPFAIYATKLSVVPLLSHRYP